MSKIIAYVLWGSAAVMAACGALCFMKLTSEMMKDKSERGVRSDGAGTDGE